MQLLMMKIKIWKIVDGIVDEMDRSKILERNC